MGNSGLAALLFALRMNPVANQRSPFERHFKQPPNTITELVTNPTQVVLAAESRVHLPLSDIESGQDSTILVRERTRNTKLGAFFAKRKGKILDSTPHTISFLPKGRPTPQLLSRRDVAIHASGDVVLPFPCCSTSRPSTSAAREEEHGRDQPQLSTSKAVTNAVSNNPPDSDDSIIYVKTVPERSAATPSPSTKNTPTQTEQPRTPKNNAKLQALLSTAQQKRAKHTKTPAKV